MQEGRTADTRERILRAALTAFGSSGYSGATTKDIAKRAGVNEVTLFRHFKSKQALFAASLAEMMPLPEIMDQVTFDEDEPAEAMIAQNVRIVLGILKANRHLFMVIIGEGWRHPRMRKTMGDAGIERGVRFLSGNLEKMMGIGKLRRMDPDVAARALIGMVQCYFLTRYLMSTRPPTPREEDSYVDGVVSIFTHGMAPNGRGDSI